VEEVQCICEMNPVNANLPCQAHSNLRAQMYSKA